MTRRVATTTLLLAWTTAAAGEPAEAPDVRTAYAEYCQALAAGDAATATRHAVADAVHLALLERIARGVDVERQFRAAVDQKFPNALQALPPATRPTGGRIKLEGDTAVLTPSKGEPVKMRKTDGRWKVDLIAMYAPAVVDSLTLYGDALRETMTAMTADVAAGKFKAYADVQSELETRIKMKLASPDTATSRPATLPAAPGD